MSFFLYLLLTYSTKISVNSINHNIFFVIVNEYFHSKVYILYLYSKEVEFCFFFKITQLQALNERKGFDLWIFMSYIDIKHLLILNICVKLIK